MSIKIMGHTAHRSDSVFLASEVSWRKTAVLLHCSSSSTPRHYTQLLPPDIKHTKKNPLGEIGLKSCITGILENKLKNVVVAVRNTS